MRKLLLLSFLVVSTCCATAQIVPILNNKTNLEIEAEARGGSHHNHPNTDGHGYAHIYAIHNFVYTPKTKVGVDLRYEANNGDNHYFRFGPRVSHTFTLSNSHPLSITGNIYGEASQYGVERVVGHISGIYGFGISQSQQQGIGLIVLINNPQGVPCVPIYVFNKTFNKQWSLNFLTYMASVNYDYNSKLRFFAGYSMMSEKYWLKHNHKRYMTSKSYFSPQIGLQWKPAKDIKLSANLGYRLQIYEGKVYNRTGSRKIGELKKNSAPFVTVRATFGW